PSPPPLAPPAPPAASAPRPRPWRPRSGAASPARCAGWPRAAARAPPAAPPRTAPTSRGPPSPASSGLARRRGRQHAAVGHHHVQPHVVVAERTAQDDLEAVGQPDQHAAPRPRPQRACHLVVMALAVAQAPTPGVE